MEAYSMSKIDKTAILGLIENLENIKAMEKALKAEKNKKRIELDSLAENLIRSYEKYDHKFVLPIEKFLDDGYSFNLNNSEIAHNISISFKKIENGFLVCQASWCCDPWEPTYTYSFPLEILDYSNPEEYFNAELEKSGVRK